MKLSVVGLEIWREMTGTGEPGCKVSAPAHWCISEVAGGMETASGRNMGQKQPEKEARIMHVAVRLELAQAGCRAGGGEFGARRGSKEATPVALLPP